MLFFREGSEEVGLLFLEEDTHIDGRLLGLGRKKLGRLVLPLQVLLELNNLIQLLPMLLVKDLVRLQPLFRPDGDNSFLGSGAFFFTRHVLS